MSTLLAGIIGGWELVLILAVVLILFGAKKVPELAKGLGQGIKEFKKASSEVTSELHRSMEEDHNPPPPRKLPPANTESVAAAPKEPTPKA
jgi:sec-independent protein translocase protein TatA